MFPIKTANMPNSGIIEMSKVKIPKTIPILPRLLDKSPYLGLDADSVLFIVVSLKYDKMMELITPH